jgi:hypothetical protein
MRTTLGRAIFQKGDMAMALFNDTLVQEVTALIYQRYQELGAALGEPRTQGRTDFAQILFETYGWSSLDDVGNGDEQSSLQNDLNLLIEVANGEYHRMQATESFLQRIESALSRLLGLLLGNALHSTITIPDDFWHTDIGIVVSRVRWWISVDDLITISNAAALAFGENTQAHRMRIARAIEHGLLEWVPDPSMANPQQNRRVLRPQVERLRDQRWLPE